MLDKLKKTNEENTLLVVNQQKPYYKYFVADHLQFGLTSSLIDLWNYPYDGEITGDPVDGFSQTKSYTPERVIGYSFSSNKKLKNLSVIDDNECGYYLPKYDSHDVFRFDYESAPHFGAEKSLMSFESNISASQVSAIRTFGKNIYEKEFFI